MAAHGRHITFCQSYSRFFACLYLVLIAFVFLFQICMVLLVSFDASVRWRQGIGTTPHRLPGYGRLSECAQGCTHQHTGLLALALILVLYSFIYSLLRDLNCQFILVSCTNLPLNYTPHRDQVPMILEATTFSIKLQKRRYLVLECLNQAPVDGSSGTSYGTSGGCSSSSKTGNLDFWLHTTE